MINLTPLEFDPSPMEKQEPVNNDSDYNFVHSTEELDNLNDILTGRRSRNTEHTPENIGTRFTSNIIRQANSHVINSSRDPS